MWDHAVIISPTLGLASVVHSTVTSVPTGAPISWLGMYIIGWTATNSKVRHNKENYWQIVAQFSL